MKSYYGKKDLMQSKTSSLSSRTNSSQLSRSSSSDKYLGYSLITNDSCVTTSRAKVLVVATLTCITAVSLVIVIIVTTLTSNATQDNEKKNNRCQSSGGCNQETSCHDYVIVGGGLSAAYAAYKLKLNPNNTVHLYEASSRIGGNLHTKTFPFLPDVKLEVGLPYYMRKIHPVTERLVNELGLETKLYYGAEPKENIEYFTRGEKTSSRNLSENVLRRYRLFNSEVDSIKQLMNRDNSANDELISPPLHLFTKQLQRAVPLLASEVYDSAQSVRTALLKEGSLEGYSCMRDTSRQMDFLEEANARQFLELVNAMDTQDVVDVHKHSLTLVEGMERLPQALVEEATKNNSKFQVHMNHKLVSVSIQGDHMTLKFHRFVPGTGLGSQLVQEEVNVCASRVILDLTPSQLRQVTLPFPLPDDYDAIQPTESLVMHLLYNGTLFPESIKNGTTLRMHTDTPLGDISVSHALRNVTIMPDNLTSTTSSIESNMTTVSPMLNSTSNPQLSNGTSSSPLLNLSSSSTYKETTEKWTTAASQQNNGTDTIQITNRTTPAPITTSERAAEPRYELHPVTVVQAIFTMRRDYYIYWKSLFEQGSYSLDSSLGIQESALERIKVHLEHVFQRSINTTLFPVLGGILHNQTADSQTGALSYAWRAGYDWSSDPTKLLQPDSSKNIFVVGQAYAPSYDSLGIEGHLRTVDNLLAHFKIQASQETVT